MLGQEACLPKQLYFSSCFALLTLLSTRGPVADALCLNAGVALAAAGIASTPKEGVAMAQVSSS